MSEEQLIPMAVQTGVISICLGFVLKYQSSTQSYLKERNAKAEAALVQVAESLSRVAAQLGENEKILERIRERVGD